MPSSRCSVLTNSSFSRSASALGRVGDLAQARRERRLRSAVRRGLFRQLGAQLIGERLRLDAHLAQQRRDDAVGLFDEREQQVLRLDLGVVALLGEPLRREDRFLRLFGVLVQVHAVVIASVCTSRRRALSAGQLRERLVVRALFRRQLARKFRFDRGIQVAKLVRACRRSACPYPLDERPGRSGFREECAAESAFRPGSALRPRRRAPPSSRARAPSRADPAPCARIACRASCGCGGTDRRTPAPPAPCSPSPETRTREPSPTPAGILTSTLRDWPSCCTDSRRVVPL